MLKLAEKLSPTGLPVAVLFMAVCLITACSLGNHINVKKLVRIAKELDEDDQRA